MNTTGHAPAGGIASHVNGRFYEGGQFIPDHGKFCGKGRNRVTLVDFNAMANRFQSHGRWTLVYHEGMNKFRILEKSGNVFHTAANVKTLEAFLSC